MHLLQRSEAEGPVAHGAESDSVFSVCFKSDVDGFAGGSFELVSKEDYVCNM